MSKSDKKKCVICGEKAGVFTRIRLNDGMLCGDCVKKCSEHLEDFDEKTADEIRKHLEYRERNKQSHMLSVFTPTITLGEYEILKIDGKNNYWMVTTPKRFAEENPDVFFLEQVTGCEVIEKKEVFKPVKEESDKGKTDAIIDKFKRTKPRETEYGYWFYVRIGVHHPCFSEIVMRVNKYIIREKNQTEYVSCKREAERICTIFSELYRKAVRESAAGGSKNGRGVSHKDRIVVLNKLVRDKIPEMMEAKGEKAITRILSDGEYLKELEIKLDEEVAEYHESKNLTELADVLEVIYALCKASGHSREELLAVYNKKHTEQGGFDDKVFLMSKE